MVLLERLSVQILFNKVCLLNCLGEKVAELRPGQAEATLDISPLQAGLYLLQAEQAGTTRSERLIIE